MIPVVLLLVVFTLTMLFGKSLSKKPLSVTRAGRISMCAMLLFTGTSHFYLAKGMVLTLPDFLPAKVALVYGTGVLEIFLGLGLLWEKTRKTSSLLLILFLVAIVPANIVAAIKHVNMQNADSTGPGLAYLWFRIPLQLLFIGWVYAFGFRGISGVSQYSSNDKLVLR